jgi:hypothetical protein
MEIYMKFNKILPLILACVSTVSAHAGGFDGPFVQLGVGGSSTWTKISGDQNNGMATYNGNSQSGSVNGLVAAGYSKEIEGLSGFNLAANVFYVIGNQNAGSNSSFYSNGSVSNQSTSTSKLKGTFGISVEPGWNLTSKSLGYLKLAWLNSRYNWNGTDQGYDGGSYSSGASMQGSINGFGYGIGGKQMLTDNVYAGVDLMGVTYNSYDLGDGMKGGGANQFLFFANIGYKF